MIYRASPLSLSSTWGEVHLFRMEINMRRKRPTVTSQPLTGMSPMRCTMSDSDTLVTASTKGLKRIAKDSQGRNRAVNTEALFERIDPEGIHVVAFHMIHNEVEYRTLWMVKLKDSMDPASVWMDCGFGIFDKNTELLQMGEINGREQCFS